MTLQYSKKENSVQLNENENSITIDYTEQNLNTLKKLVELFRIKTSKKIYYHAVFNDGKYAFVSYWYDDIEDAKEAYEFCNEFHTEYQTERDIDVLREDKFFNLLENDTFRDIFDIGWYRGTEYDQIFSFPPMEELRKYKDEKTNCNTFEEYVNYVWGKYEPESEDDEDEDDEDEDNKIEETEDNENNEDIENNENNEDDQSQTRKTKRHAEETKTEEDEQPKAKKVKVSKDTKVSQAATVLGGITLLF